jgi:Hemerythrin HHE cation binding domain
VDITQLILDDHFEQRRLFAILEELPRGDTAGLSQVWGRLAAFLELHARAEEELFYPKLLTVTSGTAQVTLEAETIDAIGDHNEIRDAVAAVAQQQVASDGWYAAVSEANRANGDHMAEEEREGLTAFRTGTSLAVRHEIAVRFAIYEATNYAGVRPVDKDPEQYVRDVESGVSGAQSGSLEIGSLR